MEQLGYKPGVLAVAPHVPAEARMPRNATRGRARL